MVAKTADPWAFMSSYPKINGKHVDAQSKFLIDVLRKEWGYEGLVMSDWGAATTVESVKYGYAVLLTLDEHFAYTLQYGPRNAGTSTPKNPGSRAESA
jgi:hypothetical protein